MDLVDRYLKAVENALPAAQRQDILSELSEDIHSEMEDKQSELGRALTEEEQQALLRQRGNPLLLAARYRQDHRSLAIGRQLIGPVLFPFYVKVLSFNLGITFAIIAAIFIALGVSGQKIGFHDIVSTCLLQLFIQLGIVTLIFSLVERHCSRHPDRWDLSGFRGGLRMGVKVAKNIDVQIPLGTPHVSRFESVSIIVASGVALAWITEVQRYPFLILGPAAAFLKLAPIWYRMYFPIVLLTVAEIVRAIINLVRPDWTRFRAVFSLILHSGGLVVVYFLIKAGSWVTGAGSAVNRSADYAQAVAIVNQCFYYLLIGAAVVSSVTIVVRAAALVRQLRRPDESTHMSEAAKQGN
ncbi:MAG TPA: hypothetical protein VHM93_14775 [Candidatus Acidoferrum sp.]|jgi:hypothetical protein|nr:hypothetical protein [Candidatus Acidoferrum sp.]